jgi:protein-S-isoprenylcysteine O-methyltransferase Ste14
MAVTGRDQQKRHIAPLLINIMIFLGIFLIIPLMLIYVFKLPWYLSFIYPWEILVGVIFITGGALISYKAINQLNLRYSTKDSEKIDRFKEGVNDDLEDGLKDGLKDDLEDELKTEGIYAYTRNPMFFGEALIALGLFLILPYTLLLYGVFLFLYVLYSSSRREEKELQEKFGEEYMVYKKNTSFFIPNPLKRVKKD